MGSFFWVVRAAERSASSLSWWIIGSVLSSLGSLLFRRVARTVPGLQQGMQLSLRRVAPIGFVSVSSGPLVFSPLETLGDLVVAAEWVPRGTVLRRPSLLWIRRPALGYSCEDRHLAEPN